MASATVLPFALPVPPVETAPRYEPYLVEVVVPFPIGAADDAIQAAMAAVEGYLAVGVDLLGTPTSTTPPTDDVSRRIATTEFVKALVAAEIKRLMQSPNALADLIPKDIPVANGVPYLSGGIVVISGY